MLLTEGCGAPEDEVPLLHNDYDYAQQMTKVAQLTLGPFEKPTDATLTPSEQHDLRLAAIRIQACIDYKPNVDTNYMIAGKIAFLLQDYETAERNFWACMNIPWQPSDEKKFYLDTNAEAHYMLARCFFYQNQYQRAADEAQIAVKHEPKSVEYRLVEAEAEAQMGHDTTAKGIIRDILRISPKEPRALQLLKLVEANPEKEKGPTVLPKVVIKQASR